MAGDWIKMRTNLESDPAVIRMAEILDKDILFIVGMVHRLWSWFDSQSANGHARVRIVSVDCPILRIPGAAKALMEVGWLAETGDGVCIPNWDRHNSKSAKRRALEADRKSTERHKTSALCPQDVRIECGQNADQRREEYKDPPYPPPSGGNARRRPREERKAAEAQERRRVDGLARWWIGLPVEDRERLGRELEWPASLNLFSFAEVGPQRVAAAKAKFEDAS